MAVAMSKLEIEKVLLLKFIEAQLPSPKALDAAKISREWPAAAGTAPSPRMVGDRLRAIRKDAIDRGLVDANLKLPCSNVYASKSATATRKRTREEEDTDDVMDMTEENENRHKKIKGEAAMNEGGYLSPPSTDGVKSRSAFLAATTARSKPAAPRGPHTTKQITCQPEVEDHTIESDSDSDSLADLDDTPTKTVKKQRMMPTRKSRGVMKNYAVDDVADAGGLDESDDDEFNPFKLRQEQEKKDARKHRARRYADEYDNNEYDSDA